MSGTCFSIEGEIEERLLEPVPLSRTIWDRLRGRTRLREPQVSRGRDVVVMTIDLPELAEQLADGLREYVIRRAGKPHDPTDATLDYLKLATSALVRQEKQPSDENAPWHLQINFSGCAGAADVSSEVAVHWLENWIKADWSIINTELIAPTGFKLLDDWSPEFTKPTTVFVPVNCFYVQRVKDGEWNTVDTTYFVNGDEWGGELTDILLRQEFERRKIGYDLKLTVVRWGVVNLPKRATFELDFAKLPQRSIRHLVSFPNSIPFMRR